VYKCLASSLLFRIDVEMETDEQKKSHKGFDRNFYMQKMIMFLILIFISVGLCGS